MVRWLSAGDSNAIHEFEDDQAIPLEQQIWQIADHRFCRTYNEYLANTHSQSLGDLDEEPNKIILSVSGAGVSEGVVAGYTGGNIRDQANQYRRVSIRRPHGPRLFGVRIAGHLDA